MISGQIVAVSVRVTIGRRRGARLTKVRSKHEQQTNGIVDGLQPTTDDRAPVRL